MEKIKTHLKNNLAIYIVILTCIIVISITMIVTHNPKVSRAKVDTSMFTVLTVEETLNLFESDKTSLLVISTSECSATIEYVSYLQISQALNGYNTYYLELDDTDPESKEIEELIKKLDMEYNLKGTVAPFGEFLGATPMTVIIKNKKMVSGYIGKMNTDSLTAISSLYGVGNSEKN